MITPEEFCLLRTLADEENSAAMLDPGFSNQAIAGLQMSQLLTGDLTLTPRGYLIGSELSTAHTLYYRADPKGLQGRFYKEVCQLVEHLNVAFTDKGEEEAAGAELAAGVGNQFTNGVPLAQIWRILPDLRSKNLARMVESVRFEVYGQGAESRVTLEP